MNKSPIRTNVRRASPFDTEHLRSDIKERSLRGGAATFIGRLIVFGISTASTVILARLLMPSDFGLILMATAITGFADVFGDLGLSMVTIQKSDINHEQISTLFWINVGLSALIGMITVASAPVIARFYNEPRLTMITVALGTIFLFGGLTVQQNALLQRQMRFITIASIQVVSLITGVVIAIVSALLGAGYWALVMMQAGSSLTGVIGIWMVTDWWPGRPVRHSGLRSMLSFGGNITAFNTVNYFARNADNILIGRFWGDSALGLYSKAYGLLMMPLKQINMPLASVVIPALSRLHGDHQKYKAYYLKTISLITLLSTPIVGWLIICSDDLILLILGSQWVAASDIFSVLGISALIQPLYFTQGWLHISAGRTDRYLRWGLVGSFFIVLGFAIGLPYGAIGVAIAYAIVSWAIIVPCMWYAGHSAGIDVRDIFGTVYKNIAAGIVSIVISSAILNHVLVVKAAWTSLSLGLFTICVTYSVILLCLYRNLSPWRQVIDIGATFIRPFVQKHTRNG